MNYIIEQIRGDTGRYKFTRKDEDGNVIATRPDAMWFTVKTTYKVPQMVLQKTLDDMEIDENGVWHFTIEPTDTNNLIFGTYNYDLEVIQDSVKTTISYGEFRLSKEVTWATNER